VYYICLRKKSVVKYACDIFGESIIDNVNEGNTINFSIHVDILRSMIPIATNVITSNIH